MTTQFKSAGLVWSLVRVRGVSLGRPLSGPNTTPGVMPEVLSPMAIRHYKARVGGIEIAAQRESHSS